MFEGTFVRPLELDAGYVGDRVEGEGVETVVESVEVFDGGAGDIDIGSGGGV